MKMKKPSSKNVKFKPGIESPLQTVYCSVCLHRNIRPLIKTMYVCMLCNKNACKDCIKQNMFDYKCKNCTSWFSNLF